MYFNGSQAKFLVQRCSNSKIARDTVGSLGPAIVQASQQALQGLSRQDLSNPEVTKNLVDGIQQICEKEERECVVKARIVRKKVRKSFKNANCSNTCYLVQINLISRPKDYLQKIIVLTLQLNDLTTASKQNTLMATISLNQFRVKINSDEGMSAVEEALNLDEGNDPSGLHTSQVSKSESNLRYPREAIE